MLNRCNCGTGVEGTKLVGIHPKLGIESGGADRGLMRPAGSKLISVGFEFGPRLWPTSSYGNGLPVARQ